MKALVLTYDKQVGLAELVVKSYLALWKECPFQFLIPRNDEDAPHFGYLAKQKNVSIIRTPSNIRGTMSALLDGVNDNEWIYWCIDDRYPIHIDQRQMQIVFDFIISGAAENLTGIKLIHWKETADASSNDLGIGERQFRFQAPYSAWGFWHHHFLRARVLKEIFLASAEAGIPDTPWALNQYFHKLPLIEVFRNIVFPVERPIIHFGETLVQGLLLANACESLAEYRCPIPEYAKDPRSILFQTESSWAGVRAAKAEIFHARKAEEALKTEPQRGQGAVRGAFRRLRARLQRLRQ